jgi:hypothetical protein
MTWLSWESNNCLISPNIDTPEDDLLERPKHVVHVWKITYSRNKIIFVDDNRTFC